MTVGTATMALSEWDETPDTVTLRVARVVYLLTMGNSLPIRGRDGKKGIMEITGLSENGAWRLMNRLAGGHHVPITEHQGEWFMLKSPAQDWPY